MTSGTGATMPAAWHRETEWEVEVAYAAGVAHGRAAEGAALVAAVATMLSGGNPEVTSYAAGARIHQRISDQAARRDAFDRGDPDVLAEADRAAVEHARRCRDRDAALVRDALAGGPALRSWAEVWQAVPARMWARIVGDMCQATRAAITTPAGRRAAA